MRQSYHGKFEPIKPIIDFGPWQPPTVKTDGMKALSMGIGSPVMNAAVKEKERREGVIAETMGPDWNVKGADGYSPWTRAINERLGPYSEAVRTEPKGTGLSGPFGGLLGAAFSLATGNPWLLAAMNAAKGGIQGGPMGALTGAAGSFVPSPLPTLRRLAGR